MGTVPVSFFRNTDRDTNELPKLDDLKSALNVRIAMGDLTPLQSDRVQDPLGYIGLVASEIATQTVELDGGDQ